MDNVAFLLALLFSRAALAGATLESLRAAAEHGDAQAQDELGIRYHDGDGAPADLVQARAWFEKSAARGNDEEGKAAPKDGAEALKWLRRAAEKRSSRG